MIFCITKNMNKENCVTKLSVWSREITLMISSVGQFTALGQADDLSHFRVNQRRKKKQTSVMGVGECNQRTGKKKNTPRSSIIRIIMKELSFELFLS